MKNLKILTSLITVSIIASTMSGCGSKKAVSTSVDASKEKFTITCLEDVGGVTMPQGPMTL